LPLPHAYVEPAVGITVGISDRDDDKTLIYKVISLNVVSAGPTNNLSQNLVCAGTGEYARQAAGMQSGQPTIQI
jgi:hypothetical protein